MNGLSCFASFASARLPQDDYIVPMRRPVLWQGWTKQYQAGDAQCSRQMCNPGVIADKAPALREYACQRLYTRSFIQD
jgi:hypothetical protein